MSNRQRAKNATPSQYSFQPASTIAGSVADLRKRARRPVLLAACAILSAACNAGFAPAQISIPVMPLPLHAVAGTGSFAIDGTVQVVFEGHTEPRLERAKERFLTALFRQTGVPQWPASPAGQRILVIRTKGASDAVQRLGEDESYRLEVSPTKALLESPNPLGTMHGLQTFLQLIENTQNGFAIPAVTIEDKPRFPWRGLMIDSGRHFIPVDVLRQNIDAMEAVKMNVLHWHLSEDQGFRIESKVFPLLQQKGSDGLYYTQDEIRSIIAYARDRGIRVVPEFDMPGHAGAWFVGYPDLASGSGPYHIERKWGVFDPAMDPTRESTYEFLDRFFGEMTALFPDAYFHIGGDECNGKEWDANPRIKAYMQAHGLKDDAALQAYFTGRVQKLVTKHKKVSIGWDEILQPDTPKDVVIQSWRGQESLAEAARRGYGTILSSGYYLDMMEPASQHYAVDPIAKQSAGLTEEQQSHVIGGESAMWAEYVSPETVTGRIWPRNAAIAERLWSPKTVVDVPSMYRRLANVSQVLEARGVAFSATNEMMIERLAAPADAGPLKVLTSVVEPPKEYARGDLKDYESTTPLNRVVDAVPPESDTARTFHEIAACIAAGTATPAEHEKARQWLILWQSNDAKLQPVLAQSALITELAPVSRNLSEAAAIGLKALDAIEQKMPLGSEEQAKQLAFLKTLEKPEGVVLNMAAPGISVLVTAAHP